MSLPRLQDWVFSIKTFGAASLALYLGFLMSVPRPYWAMATVYICSNPLSGATRSKSAYRVLGTLIGGAVAVTLVPNLVDAPELLVLALAGWTALCLYASLLDRTPRSYVFMLGGYTAALIGFPAVSDPGSIFDLAVARVEAITLGIVCASLVSSLVAPRSVGRALSERINAWLARSAGVAIDTLSGRASRVEAERTLLRLAGEVAEIDMLSAHLAYESSSPSDTRPLFEALRARMLMLLPILSAIVDRMAVLRRPDGSLPADFEDIVARLRGWIRPDPPSLSGEDRQREIVETARLRDAMESAGHRLDAASGWQAVVTENLRLRLRDLVDLAADCRTLRRAVATGRPSGRALWLCEEAVAAPVHHEDHLLPLLSALGVATAVVLASAFWIGTGWPDGSSAPMMAAVACSFFAAKDDPAPAIVEFGVWSAVSIVLMGLYLFAVLPMVHDFEMLVLSMAPLYLVVGLMMSIPATMGRGLALGANGSTLLALQSSYSADFTSYANGGIAFLLGMALAAVLTQVMRSVGAEWAIRRLNGAGARSLAAAAAGHGRADRARFAGLTIDRLGLLAPRLAALPPDHELLRGDLLGHARAGITVLDLRRARAALPAPEAEAIDTLLAEVGRHLRQPDPATLARRIDDTLARLLAASESGARTQAVLGLVGLRRALLPDADGYEPAHPSAPPDQVAA